MCGDHHRLRRDVSRFMGDRNAFVAQLRDDDRVVHQVAENGERPGLGLPERERDGVAYAKAHAQMFGADDGDSVAHRFAVR